MKTLAAIAGLLFGLLSFPSALAAQRADAVVLVNSTSAGYSDFRQFTQLYLDQFGVPYTVLDVSTTPVGPAIGDYALIVVGHRNLDLSGQYLDASEQANISAAVRNGSGLVNFDTRLSPDGRNPGYAYVQDIFGFGYAGDPPTGAGVLLTASAGTHYITALHQVGEVVAMGTVTTAGLVVAPPVATLARFNTVDQPFLAATTYGQGRAVQFGCGNWMPQYIKGAVAGLDDLVWRSLAWAARKPFVMQGLPNFLTLRVDDVRGGLWWTQAANQLGFRPWLGVFYKDVSEPDAATISGLVHAGNATASVHGKSATSSQGSAGDFFYFDHYAGHDFTDSQVSLNFDEATAWHTGHDIPISKFALGHYYELGTNVFARLQGWGVQFVGTEMSPGGLYNASTWLTERPYRLYEPAQAANNAWPGAYADFLAVPGHPEFQNAFFNCVTEIRDDAGYEWYPDSDVPGTIGRGTRQLRRAMDSMVLATLFTHEYNIQPIPSASWHDELQGIVDNLAAYTPQQVTLDYACQYVRAMATSSIQSSTYDPATGTVTTDLTGSTDLPTQFMLFTEPGGTVVRSMVDVPVFSGSARVVTALAGPLDHVAVTPTSPFVPTGGAQQFSAQGYDANNVPIPGLAYAWAASAGGTIDSSGLFTAGPSAGTFTNAVTATTGGVTGYATPQVYAPILDHFAFDAIASPEYAGTAFGIRITAVDQHGRTFASYAGQASLTDATSTIAPSRTGAFASGFWAGNVVISQTAAGDAIVAADGAVGGTSGAFDVIAPQPVEVAFNCADDAHQQPVLATTTDPGALISTDGRWTEFWYQCCRAYPSVFAAAGEAAYGLPVMRFYATGIASGTYDVRAKLYTNDPGRDMRYFYGWDATTPKAFYVDTVGGAGGSEQHAEYGLGTVRITDGNFNLYVQDAQLLSGSYPFFGWASIRLVPQSAQLDHIVVTPTSADVPTGGTQQFSAQGYDAANNPIPGLAYTWTATAGGTISSSGLFTAGSSPGTFSNNVVATSGGVTGSASANVVARLLDHFALDPIPSPQYAGTAFGIRVTAYDQFGAVLASYPGPAQLSDTTGTIAPTATGGFASGTWAGNVTIGRAAAGVTITAADGGHSGTSNAFDVSGRADLVETSVSNPPASAAPGGSFSVTDTAANPGTADAGASTTRYYLSTDTTKGTGDVLLTGTRSIATLASGGSSTGTVTVTIPSSTALGSYYLLACADDTATVTESNEGNNCIASATTVLVSRPDLVETSISNPPSAIAPGGGFQVTDTAANQGNASAGASTTRYYLSLDTVKSSGDVRFATTRSVAALAAGATSTGTVSVTVPSSTALGTYYVLACADDTTAVTEFDESNNCIASSTTVQVTRPDLVVTSISNPPSTARVSTKFQVTDTTRNQGLVSAAASTTRYYLSTDTAKSSGDVLLTGTRSVGTLAAGASSTGTVTVTVPSGTAAGTYYLLGCADDRAAVTETNEGNNCRASGAVVQITP